MKKILIVIIMFAAFTNVNAQQQEKAVPDNKLYSRFQSDDINNMLNSAPEEIAYWNWFIYNGFVVKKTTPDVAMKYPPLMFIDKDSKSPVEKEVSYIEKIFNIMAYDFKILPDKTNIYRIGDTGYIVNIYSSRKLVENYNKFMGYEK